jgi:hypothetical protein
MSWFTLLATLLQLAAGQSAASPLDRIQAKMPVVQVTNLTPVQIAGQYKNPSNELIKRVGGVLEGNSLYIFPDNTYVYCEWADIMPNTVYDKGAWSFSEGILQLKSDAEITWDPQVERTFLAVRRPSHAKEVVLVGIEKELPHFEKEAGDDPEFMLLIVARLRDQAVSQAAAAGLKARLIREGWRPDFVRK